MAWGLIEARMDGPRHNKARMSLDLTKARSTRLRHWGSHPSTPEEVHLKEIEISC